MDGIDFSGLTDDQFVALARALCAEAVKRGGGVECAVRDSVLSEAERARVAERAAEIEAERLRAKEAERVAAEAAAKVRRAAEQQEIKDAAASERHMWGRKKGIALEVARLLPGEKGLRLHVWMSADKERRVFLGHGFDKNRVTFFSTGNHRQPPGSIQANKDLVPVKKQFAALLSAVAREWNKLQFEIDSALAWDGDAIPLSGYEPKEATT